MSNLFLISFSKMIFELSSIFKNIMYPAMMVILDFQLAQKTKTW